MRNSARALPAGVCGRSPRPAAAWGRSGSVPARQAFGQRVQGVPALTAASSAPAMSAAVDPHAADGRPGGGAGRRTGKIVGQCLLDHAGGRRLSLARANSAGCCHAPMRSLLSGAAASSRRSGQRPVGNRFSRSGSAAGSGWHRAIRDGLPPGARSLQRRFAGAALQCDVGGAPVQRASPVFRAASRISWKPRPGSPPVALTSPSSSW
jgi:hypothetical protein